MKTINTEIVLDNVKEICGGLWQVRARKETQDLATGKVAMGRSVMCRLALGNSDAVVVWTSEPISEAGKDQVQAAMEQYLWG